MKENDLVIAMVSGYWFIGRFKKANGIPFLQEPRILLWGTNQMGIMNLPMGGDIMSIEKADFYDVCINNEVSSHYTKQVSGIDSKAGNSPLVLPNKMN